VRIGERSASSWVAARTHPASYPGDHPPTAFALVDDRVAELVWSAPSDLDAIDIVGDGSLAQVLADRGLPPVADRVPVLTYGGNRNPATLELKLRHYQYKSPGRGTVLPVMPARVRGLDVVAGGLSSQGYLFADLYSDETTRDTELDVHVLLLDDDQLRVMNESEGTHSGQYDVAMLGGASLGGPTASVAVTSVLAYVGTAPVFISPILGTPIALSAVQARGRRLPQFDNVGILAHALEACDLVAEVRAVVAAGSDDAPSDSRDVADQLMRYLNGQWWYRHHTGSRRVRSCERLEERVVRRLAESSAKVPGREQLAGLQRVLPPDVAPRPDATLRLGRAVVSNEPPWR
jgi:hypothetical protein